MRPYLVVEWNDTETDAKGWLCIHNLVKGFAGGGIRMHPSVTKEEVMRLAEAMGYKYKAIEAHAAGGCKAGIVYDSHKPDAKEVLKRFIMAMRPYVELGLGIGGDLGTSAQMVDEVVKSLGMRRPATKSQVASELCKRGVANGVSVQKERLDGFLVLDFVTGYGAAYCADEAWKCKHGKSGGARVVVQGFGCVGASCAARLKRMGYKIVGIADAKQLVVCQDGLDLEPLMKGRNAYGEMDPATFKADYIAKPNTEWLDVDCDILIPAALEDVINEKNARSVKASLIVEAANIPISPGGDKIVKEMGISMVPDFIANCGAIRFYQTQRYCRVEPTPQAVDKDIEDLCRRNVQRLFAEAEKTGKYHREVALEVFEPTEQSYFDLDGDMVF